MRSDDLRWRTVRHFTPEEIACRCGCGADEIHFALMLVADRLREQYAAQLAPRDPDGALMVTSGCRCPRHNAKVGGSPLSYHLTVPGRLAGHALDLAPHSDHPDALAVLRGAAERTAPPGLKLVYPGARFIHMDVRAGRWRG